MKKSNTTSSAPPFVVCAFKNTSVHRTYAVSSSTVMAIWRLCPVLIQRETVSLVSTCHIASEKTSYTWPKNPRVLLMTYRHQRTPVAAGVKMYSAPVVPRSPLIGLQQVCSASLYGERSRTNNAASKIISQEAEHSAPEDSKCTPRILGMWIHIIDACHAGHCCMSSEVIMRPSNPYIQEH